MVYSWFVWVVVFLCAVTCPGFSENQKPNYTPSQNPAFSVVQSGSDYVTIRYQKKQNSLHVQDKKCVYAGVPAGATFTLEITGWDFDQYQKNQLIAQKKSGVINDGSGDLSREWLAKSLEKVRYAFQEIDTVAITVNPAITASAQDANGQSLLNNITVNSLDFTLRWENDSFRQSYQKPRLDAGYSLLFESFCINKNQIPELRRKRDIPQAERNQGFSPVITGFKPEGAILNNATELVAIRKDALRFTVQKTGVLLLPAVDIGRAGIALDLIDLSQVRIWHRGVEQPCYLKDNGNNRLEPGEGVVFYGIASDSEYSADSIYYLTWFRLDAEPQRIASSAMEWSDQGSPVFQDLVINDDQKILMKKFTNDFSWFYMQMDEPDKAIPLELADLSADGTVEIQVSVLNKTPGVCSFQLTVEDCTQECQVSIGSATIAVFAVPASKFINSPTFYIHQTSPMHKPTFRQTGASEKVESIPYLFIDRIEYQYPRKAILRETPLLLEHRVIPATETALKLENTAKTGGVSAWVVKDKKVIARLESQDIPKDKSFLLPKGDWDEIEIHSVENFPETRQVYPDRPSTLHRKDQGYDYVIVAYQTMMDEARKLASRRLSQGFTVLLTDVQDIYDEFNFGYPDCNAITRFLRYAQSEWNGLSPEFAVLIGDSSWDHRDREGTGCMDQIPAYAPLNDPQRFGEDDYYTQLWGGEQDYFADVIIGRISVRQPWELADYNKKIAAYEDSLPVGPWKIRNVFITDDTFERYGALAAKDSLPEWLNSRFINQVEYPHFTNSFFNHMFKNNPDPETKEYLNKKYSPECTEDIVGAFDDGMLLAQYIGHGGNQIWSHERIFYGTDRSYSDVRRLKPNKLLPIIMNWSCLTGYLNFNIPPFNVCLAEEFLRYPDRGGIAVLAPSGGGSTEYHMQLLHLNVRNLLKENLSRFGEAVTETKIEFLQSNNTPDITKQYILFGDPAIAVALPKEKLHLISDHSFYYGVDNQPYSVTAEIASVSSGKAIVSMSVDGKTIYASSPLDFSKGRIIHSFTITEKSEECSFANINIYAWNEEKNLDAAGGIPLPFYKPDLVITGAECSENQDEQSIRFNLVNRSVFPVNQATCKLLADHQVIPVQVSSIPAESTVPVCWKGKIPPTVNVAYAGIQVNPALHIPETEPQNLVSIPVVISSSRAIIPLLDKIAFSSPDLVENRSIQFHLPVKNFSKEKIKPASLVLNGPGSATTEFKLNVPAGEEMISRIPVELPKAGNYTYTVSLLSDGTESVYTMPVVVAGAPELAFVSNELKVEPSRPVIGRTVRFKGNIINQGKSPARNVDIQAYDGDLKSGKKLSNFNGSQTLFFEKIMPGETAPFQLDWDPEAYDGEGEHTITFVIDKSNRVFENNKENNTLIQKVIMYNLPDLAVDLAMDHYLSISADSKDPVKVWGQPAKIFARMKNTGDTDAEFARLTIGFNQNEYHTVFRNIPYGSNRETSFEVPLVSAKNSLLITADKYDLTAEKVEKGNNISYSNRNYYQLKMPPAPVNNKNRVYQVKDETYFSAGEVEYLTYNQNSQSLGMQPFMEDIKIRLIPEYVLNKDVFVTVNSMNVWQWSMQFNQFISPIENSLQLNAEVPCPKGRFDVYLDLYSTAYEKGGSEKIQYKTSKDKDFVELEHPLSSSKDLSGAYKYYVNIGTFDLNEDHFPISFKSVKSAAATCIGNIRYVKTKEEDAVVSSGYLSALFPAFGAKSKDAVLEWSAYIRKNTGLRLKARWVNQKGYEYTYLPWTDWADGSQKQITIPGAGDYLQFYADFSKKAHARASSELSSVKLTVSSQ